MRITDTSWIKIRTPRQPPARMKSCRLAVFSQMWTLCLSGATVNTAGDWILVSLTCIFTSPSDNFFGGRCILRCHAALHFRRFNFLTLRQTSILFCLVWSETTRTPIRAYISAKTWTVILFPYSQSVFLKLCLLFLPSNLGKVAGLRATAAEVALICCLLYELSRHKKWVRGKEREREIERVRGLE